MYQIGRDRSPAGAEAVLLLRDSGGVERVLALKDPVLDRPDDLPFRYSWSRVTRRLELRAAVGLRAADQVLPAGSETLYLDWQLQLEDGESCRRLFPNDRPRHDLDAEMLFRLDALLVACADRARALATWLAEQGRFAAAGYFHRASLDAPNADVSHYLAALTALARFDEPPLVHALLTRARTRLAGDRVVLDHWARRWRDRRRRYHHLTALQARGEVSRLVGEEIHQYHLPPFILCFPAETAFELVDFCRKTLVRAHRQLKGLATFPEKIEIWLELWQTIGDEPATAYYDGVAVHVHRGWFADPSRRDQLQATLKHELIHVLNDHLARAAELVLPRWLDEGIAYHLTESAQPATPGHFSPEQLDQILAQPGHPDYHAARAAAVDQVRRLIGNDDPALVDGGLERLIERVCGPPRDG